MNGVEIRPRRNGRNILSCMVGFENNLVQMIIITKCVMNKNHVVRSEVNVTV